VPRWNTISISGYHIREAGSTAVQEVAFTLTDAIAYVDAAVRAGLDVDAFAGRLSFFFNVHNNFFEEIAKFRAARRLWARIMRERFGAKNPRSWMLRFHSQTAGSSLTAQQPMNNVVRTTIQALAAVCGGTQSLHTNGFDEALTLPTETSARTALRTQQVIAYESGAADTIDPMAGSYFMETLTDEIEKRVNDYIEKIDELGGAVTAIENGFQQREIQQAAYTFQQAIEAESDIVVGVNAFVVDDDEAIEMLKINPEGERRQCEKLEALKSRRDNEAVAKTLAGVTEAARGTDNLMPKIIDAVRVYATLGEISDAMREIYGSFTPPTFV
jgi:methylmalonyl-CoA mutase N-terminal domain/subunit